MYSQKRLTHQHTHTYTHTHRPSHAPLNFEQKRIHSYALDCKRRAIRPFWIMWIHSSHRLVRFREFMNIQEKSEILRIQTRVPIFFVSVYFFLYRLFFKFVNQFFYRHFSLRRILKDNDFLLCNLF